MSSIGLLPIMVAIGAFAFLWGMLNYNAFLNLQKNIQKAEKLLNIHRENLISFLENDLKPVQSQLDVVSKIQTITQIWKENFDVKEEQKLLKLLSSFQKQIADVAKIELANNLENLCVKYSGIQKYYRKQILQYNQLTKKMPSKLIANWFKFKERQVI